jgi:MOSC domain-containing protein YiiM
MSPRRNALRTGDAAGQQRGALLAHRLRRTGIDDDRALGQRRVPQPVLAGRLAAARGVDAGAEQAVLRQRAHHVALRPLNR